MSSFFDTVGDQAGKALKGLQKATGSDVPVVPLVRLEGMIAAGGRNSGALNLAKVEKLLDKAFAMADAPVIAIAVNSPGGSPVQSRLIHERIRLLAKTKEKTVLVFCEDLAASGGYMIAAAGDEIFADPASIVGSIGVINANFGFTGAMEKLGIERRLKTAGKSKSLGDPFSEETDEQKARMTRLMEGVHRQFIQLVKDARGDKLNSEMELFDGSVFTGEEAVGAGLIDGLAEVRSELQRRFGDKTKIKVLAPAKGGLLARFMGSAADTLEAREMWARFGV
ncbi:MAG: S49 family peptidase [Oceanicaulis sp.]